MTSLNFNTYPDVNSWFLFIPILQSVRALRTVKMYLNFYGNTQKRQVDNIKQLEYKETPFPSHWFPVYNLVDRTPGFT